MVYIRGCALCPWPKMNLYCGHHNKDRSLKIEASAYKGRKAQRDFVMSEAPTLRMWEMWVPADSRARQRAVDKSRDLVRQMERELKSQIWNDRVGRQLIEDVSASFLPRRRAATLLCPRRTALYRYFDAAGRLLYIGIAYDPDQREATHRRRSPWHSRAARRTDEWFDRRGDAASAEVAAIAAERPLFNIRHAVLTVA